MLLTVAARTKRSLRRVLRDPYELTLWTFFQLCEVERIDAWIRRFERFDLASLVKLAVLDPASFADEDRRFKLGSTANAYPAMTQGAAVELRDELEREIAAATT